VNRFGQPLDSRLFMLRYFTPLDGFHRQCRIVLSVAKARSACAFGDYRQGETRLMPGPCDCETYSCLVIDELESWRQAAVLMLNADAEVFVGINFKRIR